jgi:hypothetical protein
MRGRSVNTHVGLVHGISATAAAGRVNFAVSLVRDHPALLRLLADALVCEWHLRTVLAATEELSPANKTLVARQLAVDVRARHSRGVRQLTPHQLGQAAMFLVIQVDPAAATERYENARRHREVSIIRKPDGVAALWLKGPPKTPRACTTNSNGSRSAAATTATPGRCRPSCSTSPRNPHRHPRHHPPRPHPATGRRASTSTSTSGAGSGARRPAG